MIRRSQAETIKKVLGAAFLAKIAERLIEKGILSNRKKPFSAGYISGVLNGNYPNEEMEDAIWQLFEEKTLEIQEKNKRREAAIEAAEELTNA